MMISFLMNGGRCNKYIVIEMKYVIENLCDLQVFVMCSTNCIIHVTLPPIKLKTFPKSNHFTVVKLLGAPTNY